MADSYSPRPYPSSARTASVSPPPSSGTVTSVSVTTANGVSGSVATATTTPAITLTLGAITPTTVNGLTIVSGAYTLTVSGDGSVSGTNTGDQTLNSLLPSQTGNNGKVLGTDGSNASWVVSGGTGTVTSITLTQPATGLTITGSGSAITTTGTPTFALANDLLGVEGLSTNGMATRTATDTWTTRTLTGTSNRITITNGDGISGDPTLDISASYVGQSSITTLGTITTGTWNGSIVGPTYLGTGSSITTKFLRGDGTWQTLGGGSGTVTSVDITPPAAGITASGGPITSSGSITLALADDLAAVEGLSTNGLTARTASNTWTTRTLTGTSNRVAVTNGDGVAGNPTVDISATYVGQSSITTLGTIATGVWNGTIVTSAYGGTGNGFTKFSGPTTAEKTFTLPDSSATLLYSGGALGTPASGTATNLTGTAAGLTAGAATVLATARNINGVSFNGSANLSTPYGIGFYQKVGEDGTISLMAYMPFAGTITDIKNLCTTSGTTTLAIKINGTNVTSLSGLSVTSTPQNVAATGANTFSVGDEVTVVLSSSSTPQDLKFSLPFTR